MPKTSVSWTRRENLSKTLSMNCVCCTTPHKHWTTSRKKWTTSNEKRTRTSKSLWLVQTSSPDASNLSQPKRLGQKPTTTCEKQSFVKWFHQPLAPTSTWKSIVSSRLELSTTSIHSSRWLTSTKVTTMPSPPKTFKLFIKWHPWSLGSRPWRSPGPRINSTISSLKCLKTKVGKQS